MQKKRLTILVSLEIHEILRTICEDEKITTTDMMTKVIANAITMNLCSRNEIISKVTGMSGPTKTISCEIDICLMNFLMDIANKKNVPMKCVAIHYLLFTLGLEELLL